MTQQPGDIVTQQADDTETVAGLCEQVSRWTSPHTRVLTQQSAVSTWEQQRFGGIWKQDFILERVGEDTVCEAG